jgi:hypothetical protein
MNTSMQTFILLFQTDSTIANVRHSEGSMLDCQGEFQGKGKKGGN